MKTIVLLYITLLGLMLNTTNAFAGSDKVVGVHGRLHVANTEAGIGTLVLTIEGQAPELIPITPNGSFRVFLPEGYRAALAFSCPGHLTKTVIVETTNACHSTKGRGRDRKVEFDVMLSEAPADRGPCEEHLVGSIRFLKGSGLLNVVYDPEPVAWRAGAELLAKD